MTTAPLATAPAPKPYIVKPPPPLKNDGPRFKCHNENDVKQEADTQTKTACEPDD